MHAMFTPTCMGSIEIACKHSQVYGDARARTNDSKRLLGAVSEEHRVAHHVAIIVHVGFRHDRHVGEESGDCRHGWQIDGHVSGLNWYASAMLFCCCCCRPSAVLLRCAVVVLCSAVLLLYCAAAVCSAMSRCDVLPSTESFWLLAWHNLALRSNRKGRSPT